MSSEIATPLIFAALFALAFGAIEHRRDAPRTWQDSSRVDLERVKRESIHGTLRRRISFVLLLAVSVLLERRFSSRREFHLTPLTILFLAWILWDACSVAWSPTPRTSLRRLIPWIITAGVGFTVGNELGLEGAVVVVALYCGAFLLAGIATELLQRGRDNPFGYRFAGTLHPNQQAVNCVLLAFACCWLGITNATYPWIAVLGAAAGTAGLVLTRSRWAFYAAQAAAVIWAVFTPPGARSAWPAALAAGLLLGMLAVTRFQSRATPANGGSAMFDSVLLFGRTRYAGSLNGRMLLWRYLISATPHWMRGHGYGSFWSAASIDAIRAEFGLNVWGCHSSPFEVFVSSGLVGAILFVATSLAVVLTAFSSSDATDGIFLGSLFVFMALDGLLENFFARASFLSLSLFLFVGALSTRG